jgi:hypothetical protein
MEVLAKRQIRRLLLEKRLDYWAWAPAAAALCYPFLLRAFHALIGPVAITPSSFVILSAILVLAGAFVVPFLGLALACRPTAAPGARRLAYVSVAAPTLYVFLGVVQALVHSPIPDEIVWCVIWLAIAIWSQVTRNHAVIAVPAIGRWRVVHGVTAAILSLYVLFHITNHLFGLIGPDAHAAIMRIGRLVYRSSVGEPLLVAAMLFQIGTGLYLAWHWSAAPQGFHRTFQVASGAYLSLFILGHMNSVFVYARSFLGIPTDWNFAIGAPTGLIHDAWNIRLLPHYALGVFFVLSHIASGLRVVLIAHNVARRQANRFWSAAVALSAIVAAAIIAGMSGVRIGASASWPESGNAAAVTATLPNSPGKWPIAIEVDYALSAASPSHADAKSAPIHAYLISGSAQSKVIDRETPTAFALNANDNHLTKSSNIKSAHQARIYL